MPTDDGSLIKTRSAVSISPLFFFSFSKNHSKTFVLRLQSGSLEMLAEAHTLVCHWKLGKDGGRGLVRIVSALVL